MHRRSSEEKELGGIYGQVIKPGPQTRALERFHGDGTWTGTVKAGVSGPGSPEMTAKGKGTSRWIINGLWVDCDFEQDQFVAGKKVLEWKAKWIGGWDFMAQEYRGLSVDNNGASSIFRGWMEGDNKLVMESISPMELMGQPLKMRLTWDATEYPKIVKWCNEYSINNGPWTLFEEYIVKPSIESKKR